MLFRSPSEGLWLYMGDHPLIHVVVRFADDWPGGDEKRSSWDHVAFDVTGVDEYRRRLIEYGAQFDEQNVPEAGFQMFVRDPVGNKIELNFPNSEAPQRVAPVLRSPSITAELLARRAGCGPGVGSSPTAPERFVKGRACSTAAFTRWPAPER